MGRQGRDKPRLRISAKLKRQGNWLVTVVTSNHGREKREPREKESVSLKAAPQSHLNGNKAF